MRPIHPSFLRKLQFFFYLNAKKRKTGYEREGEREETGVSFVGQIYMKKRREYADIPETVYR